MIDIVLVTNKKGQFVSCKMQGHAQYAKKGFDIVCAAVSILAKTSVKTLKDYDLLLSLETSLRGDIYFCAKNEVVQDKQAKDAAQAKDEGKKDLQLVFVADFLKNGLCYIANEYEKNCSVELKMI